MASFFEHPYYNLNKILLSCVGTWPEQSLFMRILMPFLVWAGLMSVMIPETIRLLQVWHDVDTLLDCMAPFMVMGVSYTQLFNGSFNHRAIQKMIDRIPADWKRLRGSSNVDIIEKYAIQGRNITRAYSMFCLSTCTFYLIMPVTPVIMDFIVPLNETRKRTYLFEAEYGVNSDDHYWPILVHSYFTSVLAIFVINSSDAMFFMVVEHACGLFEVVGTNLSLVQNNKTNDGNSADDSDYKMLCYCVNLHKEAIIFADLIEASYSVSLVGVIGFCLLMLSISGVQTVMHLGEPDEALRYGSFSMAQIVHLYLNSVPGQKLMDYSLAIFDYAYAVDWHDLSPKAAKLLLMIMMRSLRPCKITAGKVYLVSMENYSSVMQTSMSYFTVLSSMR